MKSARSVSLGGLVLLAALLYVSSAHATFSIVAVDPSTGEVGGAGASCINGSFIINDLVEGVGAIHTQAFWSAGNQANARTRMMAGDSPQEIITWLVANDAGGTGCNPGFVCNESHRQYGIVDLFGGGARSAGHTGSNNSFYAANVAGLTYAIQGNILLDPAAYDVIAEMEAAFLNTTGPLADRLMAALQGANVAGADSRCLGSGKPALSSFVKVVRIGDGPNPYLELEVPSTGAGENPIDTLQGLYDSWKTSLSGEPDPFLSSATAADAALPADGASQTTITAVPRNISGVDLGPGRIVSIQHSGTGLLGPVTDNLDGTYAATLTAPVQAEVDSIIVVVTGGTGPVTLADQPTVDFTAVPGRKSSSGGGCSVGGLSSDPWSLLGALLPFLGLLGFLILLRRRPSPRTRAA